MEQSLQWYAVVNPASAHGKTRKLWPSLYEHFRANGISIDYVFTSHPKDAISLTQKALKSGYSHIISVGGDGTLNEVVNGFFADGQMINPEAELAILPLGTGSDFIRAIGLSKVNKGMDQFVKLLQRKNIFRIDLGRASFISYDGHFTHRYFINVGDVGLSGATVANVNKRSKRLGGKLSFLLGTFSTLIQYKNQFMKCYVDRQLVFDGVANSIMVANGQYIGGGMRIAPNAVLNDGFFDIIVIDNIPKIKLLRHFPKIYKGKHLSVEEVKEYRGKHVIIESKEGLIDLDGEQPGCGTVTFEIIPQCLKIWI